ncbi:MAG: hypothetical protein RLZZ602_633, partial [Pseudomonadota bacterium]
MTSKTIKSQLILLVLLFGVAVASLNLFFLWGLTKWVEDFIFENLLFQESKRMSFDSEGQASPDGLNRQSFISGSSVEAFPEAWQGWIATLGPGMHEQADGVSLMVLVQEMPDGALHYLVLDTSQLEYVESNVGTVISFAALVI